MMPPPGKVESPDRGTKSAADRSEDDLSPDRDRTFESGWMSLRWFLIVFVTIAVGLLGISWLFLDEKLKEQVVNWTTSTELDSVTYGLMVIGILATDLLLPVPSSTVLTHAGIQLGVWGGTICGFLGITLGSVIGFAAARSWGHRFVEKRIKDQDRRLLARLSQDWGVYVVVLLRPVPILAEASVLLLAVGQMRWTPFLIWLGISNLFVALFFSAFGTWAAENQIGEVPALLLATAGPVMLLIGVRFAISNLVISNHLEKKS